MNLIFGYKLNPSSSKGLAINQDGEQGFARLGKVGHYDLSLWDNEDMNICWALRLVFLRTEFQ